MFRRLLGRRRVDEDTRLEVESHLELLEERNRRRGMTPDAARAAAQRQFGNATWHREEIHGMNGVRWLDDVIQDLRFGLRLLGRQPAFSWAAVLTFTIGVTAVVLVFSLANTFVIRDLPVADPGRVVRAYLDGYSNTPYADFLDYRDRNRTLSGLASFQTVPLVVRARTGAEPWSATAVSGNYFETLGIIPAAGRLIGRDDDRAGAPNVVVLSYTAWRRRFAGSVDVIGQGVVLNGHPATIVGVAASGFTGVQAPIAEEAWVPWHAAYLGPPESRPAHLIGRLRSGVSFAQAQTDMAGLAGERARASGKPNAQRLVLSPARTLLPQMADQVDTFIQVLAAVAVLVLIVAAVNVAGLMTARSEGRRREIAMRRALGATRRRLIGQLLVESLILSAISGVAAVTLVLIVGSVLARVSLPIVDSLALDLVVDWRVLTFTLGLSTLTAIVSGLAPALRSITVGARAAPGGPGAGQRFRLRRVLLTIQIATSTILLIGTGLLVRSVLEARSLDLGFSTDRVLTASIDLSTRAYSPERGLELFSQLQRQVAQDSRVSSVSMVGVLPLTVSFQAYGMVKEGVPPVPTNERVPPVFFDSIAPGYFRTLDLPLVAGRDFGPGDGAGAPPVVIVNETLAERFWPGENPIGKKLHTLGSGNALGEAMQVVGLARNARYATVVETPKPFAYFPLSQQFRSRVTLLVKATDAEAGALLPTLRSTLAALDPDIPLARVSTLEEASGISLLPLRLTAQLTAGLGLAALILAAVGIYGMMAFLVRQRSREVGIRLALGANPSRLVRALARESLWWTGTGVIVGLVVSLAVTSVALRRILYGITPTDPAVFIAIPTFLFLVGYLAARVPAGVAARVEPLRALREE